MNSREMTFRILSLVLVGAAFMASQAGADKAAPQDAKARPSASKPAAEAILEEIKKVDEVHEINRSNAVANKANLTDSAESPQVSKKN